MPDVDKDILLSRFMTPSGLELLVGSGAELIKQIGLDVIRGIIFDILTGKNIRDSTEALTRSRISALNMAMINLFLRGSTQSPDFVQKLPVLAADILTREGLPKSERWLALWMLGLTEKGFQNILRDDRMAFKDYSDLYMQICQEIIEKHQHEYGELTGSLALGQAYHTKVDWLFITYLLNAIGAQTLTIRGSNKSTIGKLFEKLILGSLLSILGFRYSNSHQIGEKVFWLATRDEQRESDATLLYDLGKGVRFDIGFIGRGNPEISLDKVTRYQHEAQVGNSLYYMATIIIVDRIGAKSNIVNLARRVNGDIVQMSATFWPQQVARLLKKSLGFEHELVDMKQSQIEEYLKTRLNDVPLESFIGNLPARNVDDVQGASLEEQVLEEEQEDL